MMPIFSGMVNVELERSPLAAKGGILALSRNDFVIKDFQYGPHYAAERSKKRLESL